MIKIFNANDRDFSTAGNIIIKPIKCNEIKKKSLNGWYIEVEVPIKYKDYISKDKLCVVKTKSKLNPQAFRIGEEINYTTRKIKFKAEHVMFDAKDYVLLDVRPTNQNGLNALNYINERTDSVSPFTMYSNVENINTAYFIRKTLLEAWTIIEERWGGVFDADNWNISFLTSVGNDNGETIAYGKNMQGFDIFEDWSSVCTKLCPVGYDGLMLPEQFLTSDVQYEKQYTRIIDFQTDLEGEEQTEENLLAELRKKAEAYLEENKVPKVSYTIVSNINGNLEIGDTIKVLHPFVNIFTEVLEYEYNLISEKVVSLTFGNYIRDVKTKFENIKNTIEQVNQAISKQKVVINNQTNLINSLNKNGYVYIDENEILLLDAIPKEKAKNVWRFGLAGIGFSSNGYEGPFEVAITMDGQINANFITTGTMSVSRIEGLANFISETEKQIAEIEIEQGNITSRVSSVETLANNAQSTADSAVEGVNNITNTQGEATGKSIYLEDSSDEPLVSIKVKGETNQATRSGKNLLKLNDTQTVNGVTAINNGNGTLTLNGTASKATTLYIANGTTQFVDGKTIAAGTSLTQSLNVISGTSSDNVTIRTLVKIGNSTNYLLLEGEKTYTPTEDIILRPCQLSIKNGTIFNNWTIFPQLEIGESVTTPEQYGASPSPDYPAKIENVEGTYTASTIPEYVPYNSLAVKVTGKNRLNINNPSSNNMATIASDNDIVTVSSTATNTTPSVIYVFNNPKINDVYRINSIILDNNGQIVIQTNNGNGWITASIKNYSDGISVSNIVYTVQEGITAIRYLLYSDKAIPSSNSSSRYKNTIVTINDEDMTYEPYKEQTVYFPLAEGQKLYKDSYLASDGIHHKRTQVVLRGNEDWVLTSTSNQIITKRFSYKISPPIMKMNSQENALCSHFANVNDATEDIEGIYYAALDGITYIALRLNVNKATTLEQFKAYLSEQYSNGTPVTVEYELSEEEIVPYTAEQQEAWDKIEQLHTYKNVTNIFSDAELDIVYARDNGLSGMYETKQNAERNYTKTTEKLADQKMTVDGVITQVSDITSKTDELTGEVKTINSEISTVKQTIEGWSSELKNTGGNNIFYYSLDFWDNSNGLEEYSDTEIMQNSISQTGYVLNNGSAKQTQSVKNGFYTCSFNYKKLLELAVCQVKINGITYDLTETDWAEFEQAFEVKTNVIEIEFISDTDNSLYISDLMVNVGKAKLSWSQNANETRTDTVTIGKGIQVNSSAKNTYHRIDADGNRTFNKATGKVVNEATDKGTETEELVVRGQAKVSGLLIQKVSDQVWINSLL
jgi:phage minor structural protein